MNNAFILEMSQRIGWTLVHSVWQFALIALLLAFGLRLLRGCSSHLRYGFMLVALCAMPMAAAATFCVVDSAIVATDNQQHVGESLRDSQLSLRDSQIAEQSRNVRLGETDLRVGKTDLRDLPDDACRSANNAASPRTWAKMLSIISTTTQGIVEPWMNTILAAWLFGMLVLSIRPLVSWRATRVLRSHGRSPVPATIACATVRIAERLRIRRAIEVTQSTLVDVPTVIGWLKPLVLLPASAISGLTNEQLEAVIAHELAHVRRHDYLVNLFQLLIETVFFYHPAVWWVSHMMRVEREACCDDIAVRMTGDRAGYARMLLWLEESRNHASLASLGMSARGGSRAGSLLTRIRRIVSASPETRGTGPVAIAAVVMLLVSIGAGLALISRATLAQGSAKSAVAQRDAAAIRSWMERTVEFEDWSRLAELAKRMAEAGEYEEAMEWLTKIPLGKYEDGKFPSEWYYKAITAICENALEHDRLDFVESTLDQFLNPDKQSEMSKKHPPMLFNVGIAILEHHLSKGEIDKALGYLNSHPASAHANMLHRAASTVSQNGHPEHVETFSKRLTDQKMRLLCQRMIAGHYSWGNQPESIWQLANRMAVDQAGDIVEQVIIRDYAMRSFARVDPERFVELVPLCRELISRLPDTEPLPNYDDLGGTTQPSPSSNALRLFSRGHMTQLPDSDRVRYMGNLALFAAYAKRYELTVELSANVPMLSMSGSWAMDLSGSDRHPVLYAVTELQKQQKFDQALALIASVKNDAVALASLARLANNTGFSADRAKHPAGYQRMVERLTTAYMAFAQRHDEATVLDVYEGLPESLHIHLQQISNPAVQPDRVPFFKRERILKRSEYFVFLIEQDRVSELVQYVEGLLKDGNVNGAEWIVRILAVSKYKAEYQRLSELIRKTEQTSEKQAASHTYRQHLEVTAVTAYRAGNRDLCYETLMKLDRNTILPSRISEIAYQARDSGDIEFLRRMESSPSRLMREAALEVLAVHHVLKGDMDAAKSTAEAFDREFGKNHQYWSIYRTITDDRLVKEPARLLAATQLALQQVPFDSKDYAAIAVQRARLLGQTSRDQPLPAEWLEKLGQNPKLKYEVELAHAYGCWEK